ncbi:hypothetical protein [Leptospira santarosai]|uniref:hypothetical protein n=1 Tax=Leptospira santarosai TaxID=28183 RepID=UPI0006AD05A5|nr:hypothetical protein [Leptospira santarosai]
MFEIKGFDELQNNLNKLQKNIEKVSETKQVSFNQLFNTNFIKKNTDFSSIDEMLDKSGFQINSNEDFDKIPLVELDNFVRNTTKFPNWKTMLEEAGLEFSNRLFDKIIDDSFK